MSEKNNATKIEIGNECLGYGSYNLESLDVSCLKSLEILVVEDNYLQRSLLVHQLQRFSVQNIREASDGVEALKILEDYTETLPLIICDLDMPNMDGMEFVRNLNNYSPAPDLVIVSAGEASILQSVKSMCEAYGISPVGMIEKPIHNADLEEILKIYCSKNAQKTCAKRKLFVDLDFDIEEILTAIALNQFVPFYQPKVDMQSGRILGAEALARWIHPVHGVLGPQHFIGKLEQAEKIDDLTYMMIRYAARDCLKWKKYGLDYHVAVNLSLTSLADITLADKVTQILEEESFPTELITLEVTETAAMSNIAQALENLARLRMRGIKLSIDDFGTGYSSLEQLTRIAFNELKIDRSFISKMGKENQADAIVSSTIDIARKLQIQTVAEGIEDLQQWEVLKKAGCTIAQGYLISKPVPCDEFLQLNDQFHL